MPETKYIEANVLLAVIRNDEDEALEILTEMLPGELDRFLISVGRLQRLIMERRRFVPSNHQEG